MYLDQQENRKEMLAVFGWNLDDTEFTAFCPVCGHPLYEHFDDSGSNEGFGKCNCGCTALGCGTQTKKENPKMNVHNVLKTLESFPPEYAVCVRLEFWRHSNEGTGESTIKLEGSIQEADIRGFGVRSATAGTLPELIQKLRVLAELDKGNVTCDNPLEL